MSSITDGPSISMSALHQVELPNGTMVDFKPMEAIAPVGSALDELLSVHGYDPHTIRWCFMLAPPQRNVSGGKRYPASCADAELVWFATHFGRWIGENTVTAHAMLLLAARTGNNSHYLLTHTCEGIGTAFNGLPKLADAGADAMFVQAGHYTLLGALASQQLSPYMLMLCNSLILGAVGAHLARLALE